MLGHSRSALLEARFWQTSLALRRCRRGVGRVCFGAVLRRVLGLAQVLPSCPDQLMHLWLPQGESGKMSASDENSAIFVR